MELGLRDFTVLVTGASGGIGRATALAFAQEGANLVLWAHRGATELEAFAAAHGLAKRCLVAAVDVRDPAAVDAASKTAVERFGRLDVAIANAGIWPEASLPLDQLPVERVRDVLAVNLEGALWTVRAFMARLRETGPRRSGEGASALLVGSTAGLFGEAHHTDYAVSKAGLVGLLRSAKNELVRLDPRARINLVQPGWTHTPMAAPGLEEKHAVRAALSTMPLRQIARATDIARMLVVLASPVVSRHVSGQIVTVAGGMEGRRLWEGGEIDVGRVVAEVVDEG